MLLGLLAASAAAAPREEAPQLADLGLEALLDMEVSGASRFAQRRSDAAGSVTVLTRDDLLALGARTLADALRGVRGISMSTDGTYQYASVRGMFAHGDYNTRVLLLVDGNRINDNVYDQAFLGTEFPLDMDMVERIEFIPGQGSAVYGANALFGVINVITRTAKGKVAGTATLGVGSAGERQARAYLRTPTAEGGLLLSGSIDRRAGWDVVDPLRDDGRNGGHAHGTDHERRTALYLRWDEGPLTASLMHADRLKGIPSSPGMVFGEPGNVYQDTYTLLNLQGEWNLSPGTRLTARSYLGQYRFRGDYLIDYPPVTLNRDLALGRWWGLEARVASNAWAGHRWVAGAELRRDLAQTQQNFDVQPVPFSYLDDRRHGGQLALFGEDQMALGQTLTLHMGARADHDRVNAAAVSPRLALVWHATPEWTVKAIHGEAFRPPNAYEAFYVEDGPGGSLPNPALRAEHVRGNELAAEWLSGNLRASASVYRNHATDLLNLSYDAQADRYQVVNHDTLISSGLELELEYLWGPHRLRAHTSTQFQADAGSSFPRRTAWASAILALPGTWTLGLEASATARRLAAPGQLTTHLNLRGAPWASAGPRLGLGVHNLSGRALADPGFDALRQPLVRLPGRSFWLELSWDLQP
jgi:outer membrane receptor protein involved in Fe transport